MSCKSEQMQMDKIRVQYQHRIHDFYQCRSINLLITRKRKMKRKVWNLWRIKIHLLKVRFFVFAPPCFLFICHPGECILWRLQTPYSFSNKFNNNAHLLTAIWRDQTKNRVIRKFPFTEPNFLCSNRIKVKPC